MSLINDMLRDLSNQQSSGKQSDIVIADLQTASWEQEKIAHFFQYSRLPLLFISIAIFIVIFFGFQLIPNQYKFSDFFSSKVTLPSTQDAPELIPSLTINESLLVNQTQQPVITDTVANQSSSDSSNTQQIYQLIDEASRAMTLDRLTSPENDNAYFYYQNLLKLDSQNAIAIGGMTKITDRYLQMAEAAIKKNDLIKAEFFITKAAMVTPEDVRLVNYRNQLSIPIVSEMKTVEANANLQSSISVSDPFQHSLNESQHASLIITPNHEFLDEQIVKQSRDWINQGFKSKAIESLENHIQLYSAPASENYLLDLYYQDKNLTAMQNLLNSNLTMTTAEQTYYRARASILQNDNQTAITLLESYLSQAVDNENYRALLAGLYQREQLYTQATSAYRNLLQRFKPKPAYWLGLALSLDAQNQSATAIHAYKNILEFEQLEPQVREYAQDRIAQLSRDY